MNSPFLYHDFSFYLRQHFKTKVQKISLNASFTCPNRDGSVGHGGCTYCNNQTFNPSYCHTQKSITQQLEEGKSFFAEKYPEMQYLAYFQAYTNTYDSFENLKSKYEEALAVPGIVGLVIGTRPDCMPDTLLDYLKELQKKTFILVEYGIESTLNHTLKRINRGHDFACTVNAIERTAAAGIPVGGHVILGLPGETHTDIMTQAKTLSELPLTTLKLHQLQLIKGTRMADEYQKSPSDFHLYQVDEYINLVIDYIELLNPKFILERFISQSPEELLIAPKWGLKNHVFIEKVKKMMLNRNTYQGKLYRKQK